MTAQSSDELAQILACLVPMDYAKPFATGYGQLQSCFESLSPKRFARLLSDECRLLPWPKEPGVYVVAERESGSTVYIGKTGLFSTDGCCSSVQGLSHRQQRWTPYCFAESGQFKNCFQYGPLYNKGESRRNPPEAGYRVSVPISHLHIDCFICARAGLVAPAFIEALLLQLHLLEYGSLPPGNNKF